VHMGVGVLLVQEGRVHGGQSVEMLLRHGASPVVSARCSNVKRISPYAVCNSRFLPAMLAAVSVRVLVIALVVQVLLAGAFIVWAASGFPLP